MCFMKLTGRVIAVKGGTCRSKCCTVQDPAWKQGSAAFLLFAGLRWHRESLEGEQYCKNYPFFGMRWRQMSFHSEVEPDKGGEVCGGLLVADPATVSGFFEGELSDRESQVTEFGLL